MKKEKVASIVLVVIIVGALSVYLSVAYGEEIIKNIFEQGETIEVGDCIDMNYIGRYASNNTIFDSSYSDVENKTGGTPLKIFVTQNDSTLPPEGYETYSSAIIEGLIEGIIGIKEGEATIGPIPPEKAYGANKLKADDTFFSSMVIVGLNTSIKVSQINNTHLNLKWIDIEEIDNFTAPQFIVKDYQELETGNQADAIEIFSPYFLWENGTEIVNITDTSVTAKINPDKSENIVEELTTFYKDVDTAEFIFPNATTATWDDDTVTITHSPNIGDNYTLTFQFYGQQITTVYTIENITDDIINVSIVQEGTEETSHQEISKSLTFNRTFTIPREYRDISMLMVSYLYSPDIEQAGYSLHELAGESLIFEIITEVVYKEES